MIFFADHFFDHFGRRVESAELLAVDFSRVFGILDFYLQFVSLSGVFAGLHIVVVGEESHICTESDNSDEADVYLVYFLYFIDKSHGGKDFI